MALEILGNKMLTAAQKTSIDAAIQTILTELGTVAPNFTDTQRKKYGSINEQHKLLVNKTNDYHVTQPSLQAPDVDWAKFDKNFAERSFADTRLNTLTSIVKQLSDHKIAHDYDNYQASLTDYSYCQYKMGTNTPGYAEKAAELKQFFNRSGAGGNDTPDDNTPST
jgi:hypothetical protein